VEEFKFEKKEKFNESKSSDKLKKVTQSSTSTLKSKPVYKSDSNGSNEKTQTQASSRHEMSSFSDRETPKNLSEDAR
jgi:hypothetical protein